MNKKNIFIIVLSVWLILWVNFMLRDLFVHGEMSDYENLIGKSEEGKRAYVYGEYLYGLLVFAKGRIPENGSYAFIGVEPYTIEYERSVYYLYPLLESKDPEYLIVCNRAQYAKEPYKPFAELDKDRFILKRVK